MNEIISIYDSIIILLYLLIVLGIGLYLRNRDTSSLEYFLANRNLGWISVGISLFVTNISSEHFIGLAGYGASRGLAVGQFELIAIFLLVLLGWILAPIYKNSGVFTAPEFWGLIFDSSNKFDKSNKFDSSDEYNYKNRKLFASISIFSHIVTKILVTLFAGGILFNVIFGWSLFSSAVIIVLATGVYTLIGGFSAVIRTQIFQGILFFISSVVFTLIGLKEVGGFNGLVQKLPAEHFQMFKSITDPDFPWTGILFGAPIIAFWYWCTDNYTIQRILASKSVDDARLGTILASLLKIFPIFILVIPGLIAVALYPEVKGDNAYVVLLTSEIIPNGIRGLIIAGFLAAMMSSLSASFNSIAAIYTIDFYKPKHPNASERTLVLVGRMITIIVVVLVLLLIPFVKIINNQVYLFLQSTQAFISAPISAIFLFGLTVKNINVNAAFLTLLIGEFFGLSRFIIEIMMRSNLITNPILVSYANINYLHFSIYLFLGAAFLLVVLNYLPLRKRGNIVVRYNNLINANVPSLNMNGDTAINNNRFVVFLSGLVLVLTISLWYLLR